MAPRPRIACFHGGGSTGQIFATQSAHLQSLLSADFEFVFFDAPFLSPPGPDVFPTFRDYAPFRSWFKLDRDGGERSDGSGFDTAGTGGLERIWRLLETSNMMDDGKGEWVGVMGFSQGTRVVGGLLLDQQRRAAEGNPRPIQFKFGVLCVGGGPPMVPHASNGMGEGYLPFRALVEKRSDRIHIPTLHYHGLKDTNLERGRSQLATWYEASSAEVWEIDYHHAMPWVPRESKEFAGLIKQLYRKTKA